MTNTHHTTQTAGVEIFIPNPGFYESRLSALIENAESCEYEYLIEEVGMTHKEAERIAESAHNAKNRDMAARVYSKHFADFIREELELPQIKLEYKRFDSPREYADAENIISENIEFEH